MKHAISWLSSLVVAVWILSGCTGTVVPRQVRDNVTSWDSTNQNSGFIGYDSAGNGILTPHAYYRYNDLALTYGKKFAPRLGPGAGTQPTATNTYLIDPEHLVKFATMNRWRKQGR